MVSTHFDMPGFISLTLKHRETHGCVVSTVATDTLVLKHQAISIHSANQTFNVLDQFHIRILHSWWTTLENKITFWKKWPSRLRVKEFIDTFSHLPMFPELRYVGFEYFC